MIGALGVATAAPIAVAAVASADTVGTGIALLSAIGAAAALVAAVALGSSVEAVHGDGRSLSVASETPTLERARTVVADLPDRARWAIVGDALVRVAIVGVSPFLVLLVVDYEPVGFSIGGFTLAPIAVFGAFVLVEAAGAILGAIGSPRVRSSVDRRVLLAVGLVGVSLFPMALVAAPTSAGVVAVLFGLFGCRTAIEPLRPTVGASARDAPIPGSSATEDVRAVVRLAVVLAPLVAGVLYAVDPLAAFTAATTVGLLGVRELGRAFQFGRDG
ncbi:hypothetical protein [Halobiforma nitratireducens]|uniref:Transporter n=1 Tax=Halobiforma nitratireducens JCM 10879 TaxID=1227454 RepID=M0LTQ8_9EURY|nr:hypothetical protein [Halobiforma nitratireducens]EMA36836.1 transporter [Halobiforma nitratireducens JCM 10879]